MAEQALTIKQERLAHVLASGKADSLTHAAELAKVSRRTATRLAHNGAALAKVEQLKQARSDKARDLLAVSKRKAKERLDGDPSDMFLLGALKTSADLVAQGVDEEDQVDHSSLYRQVKLWLRYSRRYGFEAALAAATTRYGS